MRAGPAAAPRSAARAGLARRCELGRLRAKLAELERAQHRGARGPDAAPPRPEMLPTGFPALDLALGGGWRIGALNELLVATESGGCGAGGCGVLEAFLPALARPHAEGAAAGARHLAWIHPTRLPYPPALAQAGLDLARLLLVRPAGTREQAWAIDLALRSGACDAVISPLHHLEDVALRRLQLAAEEGGALGLLVRPAGFARSPSPAAVRLEAAPLPSPDPRRRLLVRVLRCRAGHDRAAASPDPLTLEWSRDPLDEPAPAAPAGRADAAARLALAVGA